MDLFEHKQPRKRNTASVKLNRRNAKRLSKTEAAFLSSFDLRTKEPPPKIDIETHGVDKHKKGGRVGDRGVACNGRDCPPA
jgi:hypothetical protein